MVQLKQLCKSNRRNNNETDGEKKIYFKKTILLLSVNQESNTDFFKITFEKKKTRTLAFKQN